jgi:hypothetical protein
VLAHLDTRVNGSLAEYHVIQLQRRTAAQPGCAVDDPAAVDSTVGLHSILAGQHVIACVFTSLQRHSEVRRPYHPGICMAHRDKQEGNLVLPRKQAGTWVVHPQSHPAAHVSQHCVARRGALAHQLPRTGAHLRHAGMALALSRPCTTACHLCHDMWCHRFCAP